METTEKELMIALCNAIVTLNHIAEGKANSGRCLTREELMKRAAIEETEARAVVARLNEIARKLCG